MKSKIIFMIRRFLLFSMAALSVVKSLGQDFKEDYKKVFQAYADHPEISVEAHYNLYASHTSVAPIFSEKGIIKKAKKMMYTNFFGCEIIENQEYKLSVDHKNKYVFLTRKNKKYIRSDKKQEIFSSPQYVLPMIDSIYPFLKNVIYKGESHHVKTYDFNVPTQKDITIEISFNDSSFLVERIVLFSNKSVYLKSEKRSLKPMAEITYAMVDLNPEFKKDEFSIFKYVEKQGDTFTLRPEFKSYKLEFVKLSM